MNSQDAAGQQASWKVPRGSVWLLNRWIPRISWWFIGIHTNSYEFLMKWGGLPVILVFENACKTLKHQRALSAMHWLCMGCTCPKPECAEVCGDSREAESHSVKGSKFESIKVWHLESFPKFVWKSESLKCVRVFLLHIFKLTHLWTSRPFKGLSFPFVSTFQACML